jgi:hypothetical protein
LFADGPEQRRIWRRFDGHIPSINVEIRHALFPCRCMMPITSASHLVIWSDTHRAGVDLGPNNDRVPIRRQRNLKSGAENKIAKWACALRELSFSHLPGALSALREAPIIDARFGAGQFPSRLGLRHNSVRQGALRTTRNS